MFRKYKRWCWLRLTFLQSLLSIRTLFSSVIGLLLFACLSLSSFESGFWLLLHLFVPFFPKTSPAFAFCSPLLSLSLYRFLSFFFCPRCLIFSSLSLSWSYLPAFPDTAKLVSSHPINSGSACSGTSWGICVVVCVSTVRDAVRTQCTILSTSPFPLRIWQSIRTNSCWNGGSFVAWWENDKERKS